MSCARASAVALALLAGCAPAGVDGAPAALTEAIDDDADPAVVAIVEAADPTDLRCTGTLIDERVVLTAAHCGAQDDPSALRVFFGARLSEPGSRVAIAGAVAHPDHDGGADHDLALLLLAEAAPYAPIDLAIDTIDAPRPVRLVGFGVTAAGAGDGGRKREGTSELTEVAPGHVVIGADPSLPCNGDSGGPVLVSTASGERLAAVVSRGDAECVAQSRAARVDASLEPFLRPQLEAWAPGAVPLAGRCLYDEHCESGLCLEALDEPWIRFCSRPCAADGECTGEALCEDGLCRHPLPTPGAIGGACSADDECVQGECLDDGVCSVRCVSGRDECPSGFACTHLGGVDFYCLPEPPPSACAAVAGDRPPPPLAWLALAALALRRRSSSVRR